MQISQQNCKLVRPMWVWRADHHVAKMGIKIVWLCLHPAEWEKSYEAIASSTARLNPSALLFLLIFHRSHSLWRYECETTARYSNVMGMKPVFLSILSCGKLLFWQLLDLYFAVNCSTRCLQLSGRAHKRKSSFGPSWGAKYPISPFQPNQNLWNFILEVSFLSHCFWISMLMVIPAGWISGGLWEGQRWEACGRKSLTCPSLDPQEPMSLKQDQDSLAHWDIIWKGAIRAMPNFCRNVMFLQDDFTLTNAIWWSKASHGKCLACRTLKSSFFSLYSIFNFSPKETMSSWFCCRTALLCI